GQVALGTNSTANQKTDKSWWDKYGEWVHGGLDILGFVPGLGEIADGVNGLIYLAEGRHLEAGISFAAMIPFAGDAGKVAKWGVKAGKEALETGVERLAKEGIETAAERAIKDSAAVRSAKELENLRGISSPRAQELIDDVARNSTHGSGNRLVLGQHPEYIDVARRDGGIYYETAKVGEQPVVYESLKRNPESVWAVNEKVLHNSLESGIERVDYVSPGRVEDVAKQFRNTARAREIKWLQDNAGTYGYTQVGNSWIRNDRLLHNQVLDRVIVKTPIKAGKVIADPNEE
ncbi:MAG: hypothetical protein KDE53_39495, partial [Caldilineaceae bacterium]|nr:hypothetical protein [Caldilineaceae bacterium]